MKQAEFITVEQMEHFLVEARKGGLSGDAPICIRSKDSSLVHLLRNDETALSCDLGTFDTGVAVMTVPTTALKWHEIDVLHPVRLTTDKPWNLPTGPDHTI